MPSFSATTATSSGTSPTPSCRCREGGTGTNPPYAPRRKPGPIFQRPRRWIHRPRLSPGSGCLLPQRRAHELRVENPVGHHLAALDQPVLVGAVIGVGVVQGADIVPQQHVVFAPAMDVPVLILQLVLEQEVQHLVALALGQLVDADR